MPIPLVGSPAPPVNYDDMLTGASSNFTGTNGAWTNSGGTLTNDTTVAYMWPSNNTGSLKLATTAISQYVEVAVNGTFKSGQTYDCYLIITVEENLESDFTVDFGLIGTDVNTYTSVTFGANEQHNNGNHLMIRVPWRPSANRTGVKVRLTRTQATVTGTLTYHIAHCKVSRSLPRNSAYILGRPETAASQPTAGVIPYLDLGPQTTSLRLGKNNGGLSFWNNGEMSLDYFINNLSRGVGVSATGSYSYADHAPSDLPDVGHTTTVGDDYLGLTTSQRDTGTIQMYAGVAGGYMMQLRNRGSGKGWAVSDDGTVNQRITDTFQWAFYVAGVQTTGTNKAAYFQAPDKVRIDEVRIHLGTAPTGSSFIVDVNDDGTTIFTSQGNRPEIAISGTDDTSGTPDGGTAVAKDSVITIDVDQIGSGTAGSDLVVFVRGRTIW